MTLKISSPDASLPRAQAADWLELNAVAAGRRGYSYAELLAALNRLEHPDEVLEDEGGEVEDEILESKYEPYADAIVAELEWRSAVLGRLYPFELRRAPSGWTLRPTPMGNGPEQTARVAYRCCLLVAGFGYHYLSGSEARQLYRRAARVFQVLSYLTSRGLLGGASSFWMGFPRPEHDNFGAAVRRLTDELRVGVVKSKAPPSQIHRVMDAGLDLVTWRPFKDGRPTPMLSYGQVASGRDWTTKSVDTTLESHFHHWLETRPVRYFLPAIYIPYVQHEEATMRNGASYDEVVFDTLVTLELRLGLILDRLRLTELVPLALPQSSTGDLNYYSEVRRWSGDVLRALS